jgi:hypothetical protein
VTGLRTLDEIRAGRTRLDIPRQHNTPATHTRDDLRQDVRPVPPSGTPTDPTTLPALTSDIAGGQH